MTTNISTKIHPSLCYKPSILSEYLKRKNPWSRIDHEIAATLACLKAYKDDFEGNYFVTFPPKLQYGSELSRAKKHTVDEFEQFLKTFVEEDSDIDIIIARENPAGKNEPPLLKFIQMKRFGLGDYEGANTNEFIHWLKKLSEKYVAAPVRLAVTIEKIGKLHLQSVVEWINSNALPFIEMLVISTSREKMTIYQLKPNRGTFVPKSFTREQVISFN